jgi:hypothetical protein
MARKTTEKGERRGYGGEKVDYRGFFNSLRMGE